MPSLSSATAPTVRVRDTRDLLSVIPYALGYRPDECVIVVCVRRTGGLGLIARTALEDLRRPADRRQVAELVARRAAEDATSVAYVVLYTAGEAGPGSAARAAADAFAAALDAMVGERETWHVGAGRYVSLDCHDPACCPPDGYPLDDLESTEPGARLVLEGLAPLASREELYRVRRAAASARALAGRAAGRWARARDAALGADRAAGAARAWQERSFAAWLDAVRVAESGTDLPVALLGRLAVALEERHVRDGVLLWCVPGCDELAAATATGAGERDEATGEAIGAVVDPARSRRPDDARVRAAVAVLEAVVAHAARRRTASPLTLLAFLAWWSGEGGRAGFRVAEALEVDPGHRLATLLAAALTAAVPPGWLRARSGEVARQGRIPDLG